MRCHAVIVEQGVQEWAVGPLVLRSSVVEVLFPTFTTWERPVRKSRTQLHRAWFRPKAEL